MATDFPVPLERAPAPLLLRFNTSGAGRAEAEYGEEEPPAKRCLSRLLRHLYVLCGNMNETDQQSHHQWEYQ